jgi:hypothetical protein
MQTRLASLYLRPAPVLGMSIHFLHNRLQDAACLLESTYVLSTVFVRWKLTHIVQYVYSQHEKKIPNILIN